MKGPVFDNHSDLKELVHVSSLEEFKEILSNFSPMQKAFVLKILGEEKKKSLDLKLELLFFSLQDPIDLENMASYLDVSGLDSFLSFVDKHPNASHFLSSFLKGLSFDVFYEKMGAFRQEDMRLFQSVASLEPLSFHVCLLISKFKESKEKILSSIEQLVHQFYTHNSEILTLARLESYFLQIEELNQIHLIQLEKIDQALLLVWNTLRIDLIEELSRLKEFFLKIRNRVEKKEDGEWDAPEHLKVLLKEAYKSVYQLFNNNLEAPSLEGLACLSLWNVKDYIGVGLLPFFNHLDEYENYLESASKKERKKYQENLLNYVQKHLTTKGLATIKDLENHYIFSKELLLHYLKSQPHSEDNRMLSI